MPADAVSPQRSTGAPPKLPSLHRRAAESVVEVARGSLGLW